MSDEDVCSWGLNHLQIDEGMEKTEAALRAADDLAAAVEEYQYADEDYSPDEVNVAKESRYLKAAMDLNAKLRKYRESRVQGRETVEPNR